VIDSPVAITNFQMKYLGFHKDNGSGDGFDGHVIQVTKTIGLKTIIV
jgi:hypothetical protein